MKWLKKILYPRSEIRTMLNEAYCRGITNGFKDGLRYGRAMNQMRGIVLPSGSCLEKEVSEILQRSGF